MVFLKFIRFSGNSITDAMKYLSDYLFQTLTDIKYYCVPTGSVMTFAGDTLPSVHWDWLDGRYVGGAKYSNLYKIIGTKYGGTGPDRFKLPDCRGRIEAGKDNMGGTAAGRLTTAGSGVDGLTLGASGGEETYALGNSHLPSHSHTINHGHSASSEGDGHWHYIARSGAAAYSALSSSTYLAEGISGSPSYDYALAGQGSSPNIGRTNTDTHSHTINVNSHSGSSGSVGGDGAHQNTQPTIVMNKIIKL